MINYFKNLLALDNPIRLSYHKIRAISANTLYWFPSKWMTVIWITWTNGKTTTTNIIAKSLKESWKKVFMFSTISYMIWDKEYINNFKMTSPDPFLLQSLLKQAKNEWCEYAIIETSSHALTMNRVWWIDYDIAVLTNISQDHLDLHRNMKNYVMAKLSLFKKLITFKRKWKVKKIWIINNDSDYKDLFAEQAYDVLYTYALTNWANIRPYKIENQYDYTCFKIEFLWKTLNIKTRLRWEFNIYNLCAAIWVLMWLWIEAKKIEDSIYKISSIAWRLEEVNNIEWYKVFIDYAHTPDALENVLSTVKKIKWINNIITVFWATWDRDKTKRPIMWKVVDEYSDKIILTQDDDYSENTENIIKDVYHGIKRKESDNFWIIPDRKNAIRTALLTAEKNDLVLIAGKWDEHTMMTNDGPIEWNDKKIVIDILKELDDNKVL